MGYPPAAGILVPGWYFGRAGLRLLGGLPSQQDKSVSKSAAPAQVIMPTLKFLVKHLVAFGAQYIPQVTIRHQNRSAFSRLVRFQRSRIKIKTDRQLRTVDEQLRNVARRARHPSRASIKSWHGLTTR